MRASGRCAPAGLWIVLPVRGIGRGKSRLADTLDDMQRSRFNRGLLEHSLQVLTRWRGGLAACIVVSACARTLDIAGRAGAIALPEPRPARGLDHAVRFAAAYALRQGARSLLVLACDLPELSAAALDALAAGTTGRARIVVATDAGGTGTNALLIASRGRFAFAYGAGSAARHLATARARGWTAGVCRHPGLMLDVDRGQDLRAWREHAAGRRSGRRML